MASPPLIPSPIAAAAASSEIEEVICHNEDLSSSSSGRAGESVGPDLQGPMFRKYFQTEEDDDDDLGGCLEPSGGSGGGGEGNSASVFEEEQVQLTSVSPEEFWSQVSQEIQRAGGGGGHGLLWVGVALGSQHGGIPETYEPCKKENRGVCVGSL